MPGLSMKVTRGRGAGGRTSRVRVPLHYSDFGWLDQEPHRPFTPALSARFTPPQQAPDRSQLSAVTRRYDDGWNCHLLIDDEPRRGNYENGQSAVFVDFGPRSVCPPSRRTIAYALSITRGHGITVLAI